jgi:hypothetical protein
MQHHPAAAMVHHRAVAPPQPAYKVHPVSAGSPVSEGRGSGGGGGRERSESIDEEGEEREEDEDEEDDDGMAANGGADEINY